MLIMQNERPGELAVTSVSQIFGTDTSIFSCMFSMSCLLCCCGDTVIVNKTSDVYSKTYLEISNQQLEDNKNTTFFFLSQIFLL